MSDVAEELYHIERVALPWRRGDRLTECGRPAPRNTWTRSEAEERFKALGKTRFSLQVCVTCWQTAGRRSYVRDGDLETATWGGDPVHVIHREAERVDWSRDRDARKLLEAELRGLAALVEAHPEEFVAFVDGILGSTDLAEQRRSREAAKQYVQRSLR